MAARGVPEVVSGARDGVNTGVGTFQAEDPKAQLAAEAARAQHRVNLSRQQAADEGIEDELVVFQSGSPNLTVLLAPGFSKRDPETGEETGERPCVMKFHYGFLKTADARMIRLARKHKQFGIGMLFWDAADLAKRAEERRREDTLAQIKSDPKLLQALLSDLGVDELALVDGKAPKK